MRRWTQRRLNPTKEEEDAAAKSDCLTLYPVLFLSPLGPPVHLLAVTRPALFFFFSSQLFYQLSTSRNNFLLNLTLQGGLLARQFRVEYWKRGRLAWSHPYSPHCHYVGHLQDQPHSSKVALSNCNGLVSYLLIWTCPRRCGAQRCPLMFAVGTGPFGSTF